MNANRKKKLQQICMLVYTCEANYSNIEGKTKKHNVGNQIDQVPASIVLFFLLLTKYLILALMFISYVWSCGTTKSGSHLWNKKKHKHNKRAKEAAKEYQDCDEMEQAHVSVPLSFPLLCLN